MKRRSGRGERPRLPLRPALAGAIALAGLALSTNAHAACSRAMLQKLADTYVTAQKSGKARSLPLAKGASYAENDKAMDIGATVNVYDPKAMENSQRLYPTGWQTGSMLTEQGDRQF